MTEPMATDEERLDQHRYQDSGCPGSLDAELFSDRDCPACVASLRMWAVLQPWGEIIPWTIARTRRLAQGEIVNAHFGLRGGASSDLWRRLYRRGYRCIRVAVTPEGAL